MRDIGERNIEVKGKRPKEIRQHAENNHFSTILANCYDRYLT